jgi:hypothetical protein
MRTFGCILIGIIIGIWFSSLVEAIKKKPNFNKSILIVRYRNGTTDTFDLEQKMIPNVRSIKYMHNNNISWQ